MRRLTRSLQDTPVTDIVSIGIGGSDLGPRLVVGCVVAADARRASACTSCPRRRRRFATRARGPGSQAHRRDPGVQDLRHAGTLLNGEIVREWLGHDYAPAGRHLQPRARGEVGHSRERTLPMWDWVGGRYSLWSAVGLPIALALGMPAFEQLLAGAARHGCARVQAPLRENLGAWHALTALWNRNALGFASQGVFTYDERLKLLPAHLQQLVMESLGKSVHLDGTPVGRIDRAGVVGRRGHRRAAQLLPGAAPGHDVVPGDFVGVVRADHPYRESPSRAVRQPARADRSVRERAGQRRSAPRPTPATGRARCSCSTR
jgi:glucose-6-phosphate isomerase